jgi:hypothetical protein
MDSFLNYGTYLTYFRKITMEIILIEKKSG